MTTDVAPPAHQLRPLLHAYARAVAARRRAVAAGAAVLLAAVVLAAGGAEVRPGTLWDNIGNFGGYFARLARLDTGAPVWTDVPYWFWGLRRWVLLLGQTILIAYVASVAGTVLAVAGSMLASRNMGPGAPVRFVAVRLLEFARTVPDIVFALVFVVAFGLGPLPGVLAIALHTAGTLGKLFAEVVEAVDMGPVDGVRASGGTWLQQVRFGVLPQVSANFASYALLRFEINVRGAAVIGFVGAGGIGEELLAAIRRFYYADTSAILLLILVCVVAIDWASERLRHGTLAGNEGRRGGGAVLAAAGAIAFLAALPLLDISPGRVWAGFGELGTLVAHMVPPQTGGHTALYLDALGQTLSIALLGTLAAGVMALPAGLLAARNVVGNPAVHLVVRRVLDAVRSIDVLIWALIWVGVVGLGPFAGALAIACADFGALAKLTAEAIETVDRKPIDGVLASGGSRAAVLRFGILPQVLPVYVSQLLYFFESNTRSATVIGIVGAGGIGLHLFEQIRVLEWREVSFLILMVLATVAAIDAVSRRIRLAVVGRPGA